jgi:hypothetical protein
MKRLMIFFPSICNLCVCILEINKNLYLKYLSNKNESNYIVQILHTNQIINLLF